MPGRTASSSSDNQTSVPVCARLAGPGRDQERLAGAGRSHHQRQRPTHADVEPVLQTRTPHGAVRRRRRHRERPPPTPDPVAPQVDPTPLQAEDPATTSRRRPDGAQALVRTSCDHAVSVCRRPRLRRRVVAQGTLAVGQHTRRSSPLALVRVALHALRSGPEVERGGGVRTGEAVAQDGSGQSIPEVPAVNWRSWKRGVWRRSPSGSAVAQRVADYPASREAHVMSSALDRVASSRLAAVRIGATVRNSGRVSCEFGSGWHGRRARGESGGAGERADRSAAVARDADRDRAVHRAGDPGSAGRRPDDAGGRPAADRRRQCRVRASRRRSAVPAR